MSDIIAVIDTAMGCQLCGGSLGDSPSSDFCCEPHQTVWHAQRVRGQRTDVDVAAEAFRAAVVNFGRQVEATMRGLAAAVHPTVEAFEWFHLGFGPVDAPPVGVVDARMAHALHVQQRANTGPAYRPRPPRRIDARGKLAT